MDKITSPDSQLGGSSFAAGMNNTAHDTGEAMDIRDEGNPMAATQPMSEAPEGSGMQASPAGFGRNEAGYETDGTSPTATLSDGTLDFDNGEMPGDGAITFEAAPSSLVVSSPSISSTLANLNLREPDSEGYAEMEALINEGLRSGTLSETHDAGQDIVMGEDSPDHNSVANDAAPTEETANRNTANLHEDTHPSASASATIPPILPIDQHPTIPGLWKAYAEGFQQKVPLADQLQRAKGLAFAILEHYYPKAQGFTVEHIPTIMTARHGWDFWLCPDNYKPFPSRKKKHDKQLGPANPAKPFERSATGAKPAAPVWSSPAGDKEHKIPVELIASLKVLSLQDFEDADGKPYKKQIPHTYLTILMDDLANFDQWVPDEYQLGEKVICMPRHDIVRDALARDANMADGYGFLLLGPRLEAYNYNWQGERHVPDDAVGASRSYRFVKDADPEPMSVVAGKWVVDARSEQLADLDKMLQAVVERDVMFRDNVHSGGSMTCEGPRLGRDPAHGGLE